jgi:hypothetical protein
MSGLKRSAGYPLVGIRIAMVGACIGTAPSLAWAVDWSIVYKNDVTLTLTDNIQRAQKGDSKTAGLKFLDRQAVDILAKTKTDLFRITPTLTSDVSFYNDSDLSPQYFPGISADYSHTTKLTTFGANAFFNYNEATSSDVFLNRIILDETGTQLNYGGGFSISRRLTKRDSLAWTNNYSTIKYQDIDTLEPSSSISSSLAWTHNWSPLYASTLSSSVTYAEPDAFLSPRNQVTGRPNPIDPASGLPRLIKVLPRERLTYDTTFGLDAKLTKRLSAVGSIGVSLIDEKDAALSANFIYSLNATYTLKTTSFTAAVSRKVGIGRSGTSVQTTNFDLSANHKINDQTSVGISGNYVVSPGTGTEADTTGLFITPSISYKPAKDWDTTLSYQFAKTDEDNEKVTENSVILKVSYGKTLLP